MTLITKVIGGSEYYYYQDNIKVEKKNKVITTFVGKTNLNHAELTRVRMMAFIKHSMKLLKTFSILRESVYHFEYRHTPQLESDYLEFIRLLFGQIKLNLPPQELKEFEKTIFIKYVHGTTAIEGNTLSEGETYTLLEDDLTPGNKSANEINEVINYKRAKDYLDRYTGEVNERLIKKIHIILTNNVVDIKTGKLLEQGKYRTSGVTIKGLFHSLSRPDRIEEDINALLEWYSDCTTRKVHPIEVAAVFHQRFELIHPFPDYNGRTGREILNFMLGRNSFPPIYITPLQRSEYLNVLREADLSNYASLIEFVFQRILGTIMYLFSKTQLNEQLLSDPFKDFMSNLVGQEMVNKLVTTLNQYKQSIEMP